MENLRTSPAAPTSVAVRSADDADGAAFEDLGPLAVDAAAIAKEEGADDDDQFPSLSDGDPPSRYIAARYHAVDASGLPSAQAFVAAQLEIHEEGGGCGGEAPAPTAATTIVAAESVSSSSPGTVLDGSGGKEAPLDSHAGLAGEAAFDAFRHLFDADSPSAVAQPTVLAPASVDVEGALHAPSASQDKLTTPPDAGTAAALFAAAAASAKTSLPPFLALESASALQSVLRDCGVRFSGAEAAPAATRAAAEPLRPLRIAACQIHAVAGDAFANVARIEDVLRSLTTDHHPVKDAAALCSADLVIFPETFLTGWHVGGDALRSQAVCLPSTAELASALASVVAGGCLRDVESSACGAVGRGGSVSPLLAVAQLAKAFAVAIALPFAELCPHSRDPLNPRGASSPPIYNSTVVFDEDGSLAAIYRKCHLWGAYEKAIFTPGPGAGSDARPYSEPFLLRRFPTLPVGLLICFDIEFPETARACALAGARVIVCSVASGEANGFMSRCVAPVRAMENGVCLAFVNYPSCPLPAEEGRSGAAAITAAPQIDSPQSVHYSGGSCIISPTGKALHALVPYVCSGSGTAPHSPVSIEASSSPFFDRVGSLAATEKLLHRKGARSGGPTDECVIVASFVADSAEYLAYAERNPYFQMRRPDLY